MPKEWVIPPPWQGRDQLARSLAISPVVAQVLFNRGVSDIEAARGFLRPSLAGLHPPESMPGASKAAERIVRAVQEQKDIVVFGDYDVDGITGVAILWHCLRLAGKAPRFYIPKRLEEGYGISVDAVRTLADEGAKLIITVDCGVTAIEAAALAKERGVELIITDHHQPLRDAAGQVTLPDALIVHPGLPCDIDAAYPNPHLSGAGVALKLAWAIGQQISRATKVTPEFRAFLVDAMGLAALGIVADVVPLVGENRLIAHHGLAGLPQSHLPGLVALINRAGLTGKKLAGYDVGFKLAPRLNAIGRMGHAQIAVEMLTRADAGEAERIAEHLETLNKERQTLERRIAIEAREMVVATRQHDENNRAIVLASANWHAGVIGIVASRIVEEFGRPTVLIALEDGIGQGSARSVSHFALHEALAACREHLLACGGHAMAAGLRIEASKVDAFREAFAAYAGNRLTPNNLQPKLSLDDVVPLTALDTGLVRDLACLEPFGAGNLPARFATDWLEVVGEPRTVGNGGSHLQVVLKSAAGQCKGIAFGMGGLKTELMDRRKCRAAFFPILNEWNGRTSVEMQIVDFQFPKD